MKVKIFLGEEARVSKREFGEEISFDVLVEEAEKLFLVDLKGFRFCYKDEESEFVTIYDTRSLNLAVKSAKGNFLRVFILSNIKNKEVDLFLLLSKSNHMKLLEGKNAIKDCSNIILRGMEEYRKKEWREFEKNYSKLIPEREEDIDDSEFEVLNLSSVKMGNLREKESPSLQRMMLDLRQIEIPSEVDTAAFSPTNKVVNIARDTMGKFVDKFNQVFEQAMFATKRDSDNDWQGQMSDLREMGFRDNEVNLRVLVSVKGDFDSAVSRLRQIYKKKNENANI